MKVPAFSTSIVADSLCRGVSRIRHKASTSQYWESPTQKHVNSIISTGRPAMLAVLLLAFALAPRVFAQVDDHNPVGVTGASAATLKLAVPTARWIIAHTGAQLTTLLYQAWAEKVLCNNPRFFYAI
jgi:hypothetical protein